MKNIVLGFALCSFTMITFSQSFDGFALYNSQGSNTTYLIDENLNIAHTWNLSTECNYTVQLKENGNLKYAGQIDKNGEYDENVAVQLIFNDEKNLNCRPCVYDTKNTTYYNE